MRYLITARMISIKMKNRWRRINKVERIDNLKTMILENLKSGLHMSEKRM